ncbi:hypothetical protein [Brochothrix campestris]|uniref:Uncharacterized protein n=1 Tax=Brochothrix campestris FSL F6-1037 TaxID=1265861 RepID=W7CA24_9LIST|nr:hypothetical protein [Brochothrix campestris]EUJ34155.1 hypothetical protein BCAMP_12648 [Brochothrix campestris FSL F6-1037]
MSEKMGMFRTNKVSTDYVEMQKPKEVYAGIVEDDSVKLDPNDRSTIRVPIKTKLELDSLMATLGYQYSYEAISDLIGFALDKLEAEDIRDYERGFESRKKAYLKRKNK